MSKNKLSDSLDLLLDTMCNTFGGVVFIAISLVLAFCVSQDQLSPEKQQEIIEENLQKEQKIATDLTAEKENLEKRLASLKTLSSQYKKNSKRQLSSEVVRLEHELKEIQRKIDALNAESALQKHKRTVMQSENDKNDKVIKEKSKSIAETETLQKEQQQKLDLSIDEATEQLDKINVPRLHFAHSQKTSSSPYVILLRNNVMYQLGTNYLHSSSEISVKKDKDMLVLSPIKGTLLSTISRNNISRILSRCNNRKDFLWILVHPDSFESFIKFRRVLRATSYQVYWYIDHKSILYLGNNSGYSASY